jgi:mono/diheme cytochrome c family protein
MNYMGRTAAVFAGVLAVAAWSAALSARTTQGASTNDGVYTAAQAATGKEVYAQLCESCHQPSKFSGAEFNRAYGEKPLSEIDAAMSGMPMDNPGSLKREEVAQLIAFFLSMNKYPAGQKELSGEADALKAIMVAPAK